jgi:imidazolonepropionase-like amidohydrolase
MTKHHIHPTMKNSIAGVFVRAAAYIRALAYVRALAFSRPAAFAAAFSLARPLAPAGTFARPAALVLMLALVALSASHPGRAVAQTPADVQAGPVALTGATIHTITGQIIPDGTILFEDGVITALGASPELPKGTEVIAVDGKHIYPGLVDAHSQMGIYEIGAIAMTLDIRELGRINPNVRVEVAFNPESRHIGVARSAGVLTAVTTPAGGLISGQSAAMAMDGWAWDEMTLKSGLALIVNWPSPGSSDDYTEGVKELKKAFASARAYRAARLAMQNGQAPHHDFDSRWEAMLPFLNGERPVVVQANEVRQIQDAMAWAKDEDVNLILLGGRDAHLVSAELAAKNVPVIITSVLSAPGRMWEPYDISYRLPAQLHEAGVTFAIAGTSGPANANRLAYEAGGAAAFGLPVEQALKAVTHYPAAILGLDDRIGALEVGMDATLLVTDGNPLEYATQIEQVYVRGRKSDMSDMHRQLYEKYRKRVGEGL